MRVHLTSAISRCLFFRSAPRITNEADSHFRTSQAGSSPSGARSVVKCSCASRPCQAVLCTYEKKFLRIRRWRNGSLPLKFLARKVLRKMFEDGCDLRLERDWIVEIYATSNNKPIRRASGGAPDRSLPRIRALPFSRSCWSRTMARPAGAHARASRGRRGCPSG